MLLSLINDDDKFHNLLIEDNSSVSSSLLLNEFVVSASLRGTKVTYVCFDRLPSIACQSSKNITIYDGVTDTYSWNGVKDSLKIGMDADCWNSLTHASSEANLVVIDSLNTLMLHLGVRDTLSFIRSLRDTKKRLIMVCHNVERDSQHISFLREAATTIVRLRMSSNFHDSHPNLSRFCDEYECHVLHKQISGKIVQSWENVKWQDSMLTVCSKDNNISFLGTPSDSSSDKFSKLTFNVGLSDSQRTVKNQIILPYIRAQYGVQDDQTYDTDEEIDLDEDPDDDLDI